LIFVTGKMPIPQEIFGIFFYLSVPNLVYRRKWRRIIIRIFFTSKPKSFFQRAMPAAVGYPRHTLKRSDACRFCENQFCNQPAITATIKNTPIAKR
ncbi:hypothetical protein, partial [Nostoc sp. 'Peltigera membranacea cyanobiont' 213]|uniref:hypothetical protein n=1 Tax=Nostoc sp. 'Peltigera membranacea cyanobiont' 213 TaxID=2014530 RepID=UPI001CB918E1